MSHRGSRPPTKRLRDLLSPAKSTPESKRLNSETPTKQAAKSRSIKTGILGTSFFHKKSTQSIGASIASTSSVSRPEVSELSNQNKQENDLESKEEMSLVDFKRNLIASIRDPEGAEAFRDMLQPIIPDNTNEIRELLGLVKKQRTQIASLEEEVEYLKQQATNKSIIITGVREIEDKSTEDIAIKLCKEVLGVNLHPHDCDGIFRLGQNKNKATGRSKAPATIQINLTTNRKKTEIMMNKKKLKNLEGEKIFINEMLTKRQNEIFYWARNQVREKKIAATWSRDGKIYIKTKVDDKPVLV